MICNNYHISLANYFAAQTLFFDGETQKKPNIRKLVEQPWQQTKGEMWDEVTETLCNLHFIQAKAVAKKTYELVDDFNETLKVIPDNTENIRQEKARQERMDKYTRDLIACGKGEITRFELEVPESITPRTQKQINDEIERIKTSPTKADLLKDFLNFSRNESSNLQNYACELASFTHQQAWNYAGEGPVGKAADKLTLAVSKFLLRHYLPTRPSWNPLLMTLQILKDHSSTIHSVSLCSEGKHALSGSHDRTCILWDLMNGEKIKTLKEHTSPVWAVSTTPDGKYALSGSGDKTCILWNLISGEAIKILRGHTESVMAVSITPDGKYALSGSKDKTCIFWNLISGEAIQTLYGHTSSVWTVSISCDGKYALSGSEDKTCVFWNLISGEVVKILKGHTNDIMAVSITPGGKYAISGSLDKTCILWDLSNGEKIKTLKEHTSYVMAVSISPDGKYALSGSWDKTCILWNLISGEAIKIFKGHTSVVDTVSISPDGKHALSGSWDNTCILWNLISGESIKTFEGHTSRVNTVSISNDGRHALSGSEDNTCILWNLKLGKRLARFVSNSPVASVALFSERVVLGGRNGEVVILNLEKELLFPGLAIATIRQIWDLELKQYQSFSADCPLCGHSFSPTASVLTNISEIIKKARLKPEQSPCLELPDEVWVDPGLLGKCPNCGEGLKFNPFIAGGEL